MEKKKSETSWNELFEEVRVSEGLGKRRKLLESQKKKTHPDPNWCPDVPIVYFDSSWLNYTLFYCSKLTFKCYKIIFLKVLCVDTYCVSIAMTEKKNKYAPELSPFTFHMYCNMLRFRGKIIIMLFRAVSDLKLEVK